jgi:hypothetical protein
MNDTLGNRGGSIRAQMLCRRGASQEGSEQDGGREGSEQIECLLATLLVA